MKFSGYLLLYEDTSAIDFGPDRFTPLAGHAPKVGHNELDCLIELKLKGYVWLHWILRRINFCGDSSTRLYDIRVLVLGCEIMSKYYSIVMKFSVYLPLYEEAITIDFGPDWSIR